MTNEEKIIAPEAQDGEESVEQVLRPQVLEEYIGQESVKDQMNIFIEAAKKRNEAMDHVLIFGPPGLGKTTLAHVIANELGVNLKHTSGPAIEKPGDLAAILTNLEERDVLFVDEIHRLSSVVEEILYPALEDYQLDLVIGEGPSARSIKLDLTRFTMIGATTRAGLLTSPLRDRFGISQRLDFYNVDEITKIVNRSSGILGVEIDQLGAEQIASRSRGTPRIANSLLRRVRDFAQIKGDGKIDINITKSSLKALNVDVSGLDEMDNKILSTIIDKFAGGPVGLTTLATAVSENPETIEEVYEPFLIQQGFIMRTPRGREATELAFKHLNKEFKSSQKGLF